MKVECEGFNIFFLFLHMIEKLQNQGGFLILKQAWETEDLIYTILFS